jgi:hypothetical protein
MKNISLGLIFTLALLPQISFGATVTTPVNPQQAACTKQLDAQAVIFFQQQGAERGAFIKANQALIAAQDQLGKWKMAGGQGTPPPGLTAAQQNTLSAFTAQEQAEKTAFFKQQAIAMQACLGGTTTTGTTT